MKRIFQNLKFISAILLFSFYLGNTSYAQVTLNLKLYLEAYYASSNTGFMDNYGAGGCLFINGISTDTSDVDTVMISAMDAATLIEVEAKPGILKTDGNVNVIFTTVNAGSSYFIKVNHRNVIQTWSANPVIFNAVTNYDFSLAQTQAFGNNMILTQDGLHWAFYSGDINQDCYIDSIDRALVEFAIVNTLTGYVTSDITGDGVVESLDLSITEDHSFFQIKCQNPILNSMNELSKEGTQLSNLIVYPNPNLGCFNLMFNSKNNESKEIIIYNFQGRIILRNIILACRGKNTINLELDTLIEGNYIIQLTSKNEQPKINRFNVIK